MSVRRRSSSFSLATSTTSSSTNTNNKNTSSSNSSSTHSPQYRRQRGELLRRLYAGVTVKNRRYNFRMYKNCFVASEAVDFMVESGWATSRDNAIHIGIDLQKSYDLFEHVVDPNKHPFDDKHLYFRFNYDVLDNYNNNNSSMNSSSSNNKYYQRQSSNASTSSTETTSEATTVSSVRATSRTRSRSRSSSFSSYTNNNNNISSGSGSSSSMRESSSTSSLSSLSEMDYASSLGLHSIGGILLAKFPMRYKASLDCYGFHANEAIDYMIQTGLASSRKDGVLIGLALKRASLIKPKGHDTPFDDQRRFFQSNLQASLRLDDDDDDDDDTYHGFQYELKDHHQQQHQARPQPTKDSWKEALDVVRTDFADNMQVSSHKHHLKKYKNCFTGTEAVDWLIGAGHANDRLDAVWIGRALAYQYHLFQHVANEHEFKDSDYFYFFSKHATSRSVLCRLEQEDENECVTTDDEDYYNDDDEDEYEDSEL